MKDYMKKDSLFQATLDFDERLKSLEIEKDN